jgi:D-psicose/D-tagatose/L-ribulose 3-epimerase
MKFGINTLLWCGNFSTKELPLFKRAAQMGFDGVEVAVFAPELLDSKAARAVLRDYNLDVAYCTVAMKDANPVSDDPKVRVKALDSLKRHIEKCAEIGGRVICGPLYAPVGHLVGRGRTPAEWRNAVGVLRQAARFAQQHDVTLALEPLNRFETYFLNTAEDTVRFCKEVGEPNVAYHFDTFHANVEEKDLAAAIRKAGRYVRHVHTCENDRGVPGTGHVDWKGVFAALKAIGYDGWLVIESFVPAIKEIAAAAAIWRRIAPSADAIALEGQKFIRRMAKA